MQTNIKVFAFDIFNTVFSLGGIPREEIVAYGEHIKRPWSPLKLPEHWERLPAWPDSRPAIHRLKQYYQVVTCSNGPISLQTKLSKYNDIDWDFLIPLEERKIFKPSLLAYQPICDMMGVKPEEVCMVTANETFGDLEASAELGMHQVLITRGYGQTNLKWETSYDLISLANKYIQ